ncbi:macrophage scavenger receptor types I and II-like [Mercenaria mercenaria]|uniref:macrophage scavenger receptor types I and II-like n=1 Tax=Mercenaria mercenaria TaxID=6596 RepID=UPI00234F38B7|nr:macrophage scavenger receptor types I and II-like [Mercenaria mercenaria]
MAVEKSNRSIWTYVVFMTILLQSIPLNDADMPVDMVYNILSSRLDAISFDIRLFRSTIDGVVKQTDEMKTKMKDFSGLACTCDQSTLPPVNQTTQSKYSLKGVMKRQVIQMQRMVAVEKKFLREVGKEFAEDFKDVNEMKQRLNNLERTVEKVRDEVKDETAMVDDRLKKQDQVIASIKVSAAKGEKGQKGDAGPEGPMGVSVRGEPGLDGLPGFRGMKGQKGDQGPSGRQGPMGPPGQKGEGGNAKLGPFKIKWKK